jgi:hypothetical protein
MADQKRDILLKNPLLIGTHMQPLEPRPRFDDRFRSVNGFVAGILAYISAAHGMGLTDIIEWREANMHNKAYFAPLTADPREVQGIRLNLSTAWDQFLDRHLWQNNITAEAFYAGAGRLVVPPPDLTL